MGYISLEEPNRTREFLLFQSTFDSEEDNHFKQSIRLTLSKNSWFVGLANLPGWPELSAFEHKMLLSLIPSILLLWWAMGLYPLLEPVLMISSLPWEHCPFAKMRVQPTLKKSESPRALLKYNQNSLVGFRYNLWGESWKNKYFWILLKVSWIPRLKKENPIFK